MFISKIGEATIISTSQQWALSEIFSTYCQPNIVDHSQCGDLSQWPNRKYIAAHKIYFYILILFT